MKTTLLLYFFLLTTYKADAQWFWQNPLPQGNPLTSICFTDEYTGWAFGTGGTILNTKNGGDTWETQISGTDEYLISSHFYNSNIGWVVGSNGLILKTTNGG
jgi:photosystem II stability/assembly factor-like uncharacterized protein